MAAETAATGGQAEDLAHVLSVTRRTLLRWSEQAGLPPPRRLMAWMRILLAAAMLDEPGLSILEEFPTEFGSVLWQSHRTVRRWASAPPQARRRLFLAGAYKHRMRELEAVRPDAALEQAFTTAAEAFQRVIGEHRARPVGELNRAECLRDPLGAVPRPIVTRLGRTGRGVSR